MKLLKKYFFFTLASFLLLTSCNNEQPKAQEIKNLEDRVQVLEEKMDKISAYLETVSEILTSEQRENSYSGPEVTKPKVTKPIVRDNTIIEIKGAVFQVLDTGVLLTDVYAYYTSNKDAEDSNFFERVREVSMVPRGGRFSEPFFGGPVQGDCFIYLEDTSPFYPGDKFSFTPVNLVDSFDYTTVLGSNNKVRAFVTF